MILVEDLFINMRIVQQLKGMYVYPKVQVLGNVKNGKMPSGVIGVILVYQIMMLSAMVVMLNFQKVGM